MSVDILMGTFNGAEFLENQLLSLQQQTYKDWRLIVRDDGSTDRTLSILESFAKHDSRIEIIKIDSGLKLGPGRNFLDLLKYSNSEYVMFCDQDDICFERKIEMFLKDASLKFDPNKPCLLYCDAYGYSDKEGIITITSVSTVHAEELKDFLFFNGGYYGCLLFFNAKLRDIAADYKAEYFFMHDSVVVMIAKVFGEVIFLNKKLHLYRQHEKNVTGKINKGLLSKIKSNHIPVISEKHYREKSSFLAAYYELMSDKDKYIFEEYMKFPHLDFINRSISIFKNRFTYGGSTFYLFLKNIFRKSMN